MGLLKDHYGKASTKRVLGLTGGFSAVVAMFLGGMLGISDYIVAFIFVASGALLGVGVFEKAIELMVSIFFKARNKETIE